MNGITQHSLARALLFSLLIIMSPSASSAFNDNPKIFIVKSGNNDYFNETIATLKNLTKSAVQYEQLTAAESIHNTELMQEHDLVIALGLTAVEAVNRSRPKARVINAYLTYQQYQRYTPRQHDISLLLNQPLERYLALSHLLPGIKSIGIIDHQPRRIDQNQARKLRAFGLELNQYQSSESSKLLPTLRLLLKQNDGLLMLPDQSIYQRASLKGVLLTSYRFRKPVISYSPAHVKSGALATIYSSPKNIGQHIALVVDRLLSEAKVEIPTFEMARFYSVMTNSRVARALGIDLPSDRDLIEQLQEILK
ncbi:MAG: putative ABC transport system substrate-binding protein [Gammaproteobacteria bacterium]|jgi:putative ABC transport system substrate-binding protein